MTTPHISDWAEEHMAEDQQEGKMRIGLMLIGACWAACYGEGAKIKTQATGLDWWRGNAYSVVRSTTGLGGL